MPSNLPPPKYKWIELKVCGLTVARFLQKDASEEPDFYAKAAGLSAAFQQNLDARPNVQEENRDRDVDR